MVTVTSFIRAFSVNFTPSTEIDIDYYEIHASQTQGFTPNESTLINRGPETSYFHRVDVGGTYYVRIGAVDVFGPENTNYSAEYSVYVGDMQLLPNELYTTMRTDFWVNNSIFRFTNSGTASTTLEWTAGSVFRADATYTLAQGTMASANNKYIIATLSAGAATLSSVAFGAAPVLNDNQIIIAVTSSSPSSGTNNYLCYMRQANSVEFDGAILRQATVGTLQVADAAITQAKVYGLVVGDEGITMGENATISWDNVDGVPNTIMHTSTYIDAQNVATFNVYAENISGNTITGKTLQTSSDVNAKRFVVSSADGEAHFFADNGYDTIEELITIGLSQVSTDYILIKSGSANTSNMAFRGETKGGVTTEIVNNGTSTINVGIRVYVPGDTGATYGIRSDVQSNGIGVLGQAGSSGSYYTGTGVCATGSYLGGDFNAGSAGALRLGSRTSDPVSSVNGATYYNSSTHKFRKNVNGTWADF